MTPYALSHLSDEALLHGLSTLVAQDRTTAAAMLAHIAEVDERRLYLPAGYDSMFTYCVGELRLSEDAAAKRIQAARAARRFPAITDALAQGRLHLTGVGLLAPHLTEQTAAALLAAATDRSKAEIERLIAERYPRPDVLAWVAPIPTASPTDKAVQHAPAHVDEPLPGGSVGAQGPGPVVGDRSSVKPLSSQSYEVTYTMSQRAHDLLCTAQALLAHQIPSGDVAQVIERALELLVPHLQQRKYATTSSPRPGRGSGRNPRFIPAEVTRAVWERDRGQCTYVSESGHRCQARKRIEFDHVVEVARGGEATVEGLRLRCRAHNQYAAERMFGAAFMRRKRREATAARATARAERATKELAAATRREGDAAAARARAAVEQPHVQEVIPWLQALGCRMDEARRAAERCADMPDASLHDRVRRAVSGLGRGRTHRPSPETSAAYAGGG